MAAAKQGETTWFKDTGATNHVTSDLNNLSIHSDYVGNNNLVIGNGKGLPISHAGSSRYFSNGNLASLHNILHVPTSSYNLLSVSQFTKDNDCDSFFTSSGFYMKENRTGKILFYRVTSNGLYPLHLNQCIKNKLSASPSFFKQPSSLSRSMESHIGSPLTSDPSTTCNIFLYPWDIQA